eukprot:6176405-Pleurochrysis_carterae.AAC.3
MFSINARLCFWYSRSEARSPSGSGFSSEHTCTTSCITRSAVHALESRGGAKASRLRRSEFATIGGRGNSCAATVDANAAPCADAGAAADGWGRLLHEARTRCHVGSLCKGWKVRGCPPKRSRQLSHALLPPHYKPTDLRRSARAYRGSRRMQDCPSA